MTPISNGGRFFQRHSWRILVSTPQSGATNMAIDEALLARAAQTHEAVLRLYRWQAPTLSLGRHQIAREAYDEDKAKARGVSLVRRLTGGRALLHWREVTYSVTAPLATEGLKESYGAINTLLLKTLRTLGVTATIAERSGRLPSPASAPCFELPAEGEILFDGRKLVGSAQFRSERALLQHGSILIADDQPLVAQLARRPIGVVAPAATLEQALGEVPDFDHVAAVMKGELDSLAGASSIHLDPEELTEEIHALRARYESDAWTWER